ncbi:MAG: hypothetical protein KF878_10280 [Planctomycetes bacterium]|nr:hypothetical protein [Planctomycetota bacterium]
MTATIIDNTDRAALAAAERARVDRTRALARAVVDGPAPDPAEVTPDVLAEARRLRALRDALAARRELPALRAREAEARERAAKRRAELVKIIETAQAEMSDLGRASLAAATAASEAAHRAAGATAALTDDDRRAVLDLERLIEANRARANALRRAADEAPGLLARIGARVADLAGRIASRRWVDDALVMERLTRDHDEATAEQMRLAALSPAALRREADDLDRQAADHEAALAALWEKIAAAAAADAAPAATPAATSTKGRRSR